jgi:multidrug efflux pump subunit AcrB
MIQYLIHRPIAVMMVFAVLLFFGVLALVHIPVSLLPNIDVPKIVVKVNYPNASASAIEENIVRKIRERLATLQHLHSIESACANHACEVVLQFDYGTRMDLANVEVTENVDQLASSFPRDMPRPQIVRVNTSDVAILRLQVVPKRSDDYVSVSALASTIIKKRIEQIEGVSLVDINGTQSSIISLKPDQQRMQAWGLTVTHLREAIKEVSATIGVLSVKDGNYRYFVKLENAFETIADIEKIPIKTAQASVIPLKQVVSVTLEPQDALGAHLFNGKKSLVIAIHKQNNARMNELLPRIHETINGLSADYPSISFQYTRDQMFVLDAGIDNLNQDLIFGGVFCVALLFLFLGNYVSPILMSVSIPASLIITFVFFYLFDISFNIISLSGLALGIGLLIDNSIVVLENINRHEREGKSVDQSCVYGTNEMIVPVVSQVLTTIAVYAPLIYLSGLAGALVYDQAIALTISLTVSLSIAFFLNPVMYKLVSAWIPMKANSDTRFFRWVHQGYHRMMDVVFSRKRLFLMISLCLMPIGVILLLFMPVNSLPPIEETECIVLINWNEPIGLEKSRQRVITLTSNVRGLYTQWEADLGKRQFLFQQASQQGDDVELYFRSEHSTRKDSLVHVIQQYLKRYYPASSWEVKNAPNAFTQLFENPAPFLEARIRPVARQFDEAKVSTLASAMTRLFPHARSGAGFMVESTLEVKIHNEKLALYKIQPQDFRMELEAVLGDISIGELNRFGNASAIYLRTNEKDFVDRMNQAFVTNRLQKSYPLKEFITWSIRTQPRYVTSDHSGVYRSVLYPAEAGDDVESIRSNAQSLARESDMIVDFTGRYFDNRHAMERLAIIFFVALLLLYVILSVQFENLIHPILVMLTIPLGVLGATTLLWLYSGSLDVMAAIGFVVVLGIIVDDPILKVETINRLRKLYTEDGKLNRREALEKAIHEAGSRCLKPLLMTSLTTSLAVLPVLFTPGIGSDLQKPMVYVVIGGLTIGTFFTVWFIPLCYWFLSNVPKRDESQ